MRRTSLIFFSALISGFVCLPAAQAQQPGETEGERPGTAAPPPPIPPLPPKVQDDAIEPTVRIITGEEDELIEEYSKNGRVYMVKVTPAHGKPYFYMDLDGDGQLELQDRDDAFSPVKPAVWKVKEW